MAISIDVKQSYYVLEVEAAGPWSVIIKQAFTHMFSPLLIPVMFIVSAALKRKVGLFYITGE